MFQTFRNACISLVQQDAITEVLLFLCCQTASFTNRRVNDAHTHMHQHQARGILITVCANENGKYWSWLSSSVRYYSCFQSAHVWVMRVILLLAVHQTVKLADAWTEFKSDNDIAGLQNRSFTSTSLSQRVDFKILMWHCVLWFWNCDQFVIDMVCFGISILMEVRRVTEAGQCCLGN